MSSNINLSSGLRLSLTVNSTEVYSGKTVRISVDLFNPLITPVNLSVAKLWPSNAYLFMPPSVSCGVLNYPVGMGIFKGYYSASNMSLAKPFYLDVANGSRPVSTSCPPIFLIRYHYFHPQSDMVGGVKANGTYGLRGYWVVFTDHIPTYSVFHDLEPGAYTVIAATEWGDVTFLHFVVK